MGLLKSALENTNTSYFQNSSNIIHVEVIKFFICSFAHSFTYIFLDLINNQCVPAMCKILFIVLEILQTRKPQSYRT